MGAEPILVVGTVVETLNGLNNHVSCDHTCGSNNIDLLPKFQVVSADLAN
jgi:hypothetical protein